ncbi:hypothetical protein C4571_02720 [Candidatus Parcubacteria bacterium]|nr:MAG: hypothetical protein C4571_02720 [Candidatus Parcubacteria bacterium]
MKKFSAITLLILAVFLPLALAFAQGGTPQVTPVQPPRNPGPIQDVGQGLRLLDQILTWIATIFWIAAAVFILYAGFLYLTASGDPEKVQKANHQLIYAVVAIVIGIMAFGLPVLVENFLRGR